MPTMSHPALLKSAVKFELAISIFKCKKLNLTLILTTKKWWKMWWPEANNIQVKINFSRVIFLLLANQPPYGLKSSSMFRTLIDIFVVDRGCFILQSLEWNFVFNRFTTEEYRYADESGAKRFFTIRWVKTVKFHCVLQWNAF